MASQPVALGRHGKPTAQQIRFIKEMAQGDGNKTKAARLAEYADPEESGWRLMQNPAIVRAVHEARERLIQGECASLALTTMQELMKPGNPGGVRFQAAKYFLDAAGHGAKGEEGREKSLSEMSAEELASAISKLDDAYAKLADGAKPVPTVIENGQGTKDDNAE